MVADDVVAVAVVGRPLEAMAPAGAVREVPGDDEGGLPLGAGRQAVADHEGAGGHAGALGGLGEPAVGGEVVPEVQQRVAPGAARPGQPLAGDGPADGGERQCAPALGVLGDLGGVPGEHGGAVEFDAAEDVARGQSAGAAAAGDVLEVAADVDRQLLVAGGADPYPVDEGGDAAGLGVAGDERVEDPYRRFHRQLRAGQPHLAEGVGGGELALAEARQAGQRGRAAGVARVLAGEQRRFEDAGERPGGARRAQAEERVGGELSCGRCRTEGIAAGARSSGRGGGFADGCPVSGRALPWHRA